MKKVLLFFLITLCVQAFMFSQCPVGNTLIESQNGATTPAGWTVDDQRTSSGGYWLLSDDAGSVPNGEGVITAAFDVSAYTMITVNIDVATFGSGTNRPAIIEFSTDGGANYDANIFTTNTPSSSSYIDGGDFTFNVPSGTTNLVIRLSRQTGSGRDVRARNFNICGALGSLDTEIQFNGTTATVNEDAGTVTSTVCVSITNEDATNATTADVTFSGGTAIDGTDTNAFGTQSISFPAGSSTDVCISFTIIDDALDEGNETIEFTLSNPGGGNNAALGTNTVFTVTISDNDFVAPNVIINEVDSDTPGTDAAEFIELFGTPNLSLDGLVVVLVNGSDNLSYASYDLDGLALDANGYLLLGNSGVGTVEVTISNNSIQNGPDAVALYLGNGSDYPNDTDVNTTNLIDAVIHKTNDADDPELQTKLGLTAADQVDEGENGNKDAHSVQRGSWFVAPATPRAMNMALPVEMTLFRAQKESENVMLHWQTASETHNDRFEVEHSTTGINFQRIGEVKGAHNSHVTLNYEYKHQSPANGTNYYRLRQVDEDGAFEYSNVVSVVMGKDEAILVRPNIVESNMFVELDAPADNDVLLEVFDLQGRLVLSNTLASGAAQIELDLSSLNAGKYFIKALNNGKLNVIRFVKQ